MIKVPQEAYVKSRMTKFFSTGEAASLLGISRSTVSRRFDAGEFTGRVNAVTGERFVSRDSLLAFARTHDVDLRLPESTPRRIVLATGQSEVRQQFLEAFSDDRRFELCCCSSGARALVACVQQAADLLVIGGELADINPANLIESLEHTQHAVTMRILILAHDGESIAPEAAEKVGKLPLDLLASASRLRAAICETLGMLSDEVEQPREAKTHVRHWERIAVSVPCDLLVYPNSAPDRSRKGTARIRNISEGGAYLDAIELEPRELPAEPFRMRVHADAPPLEGWSALCIPMRIMSNGTLGAGVCFEGLDEQGLHRIQCLEHA